MNTHEVALTKGEGRSIWLLGDLYTFKVTGEALSVTELTAFPQNGPPPHIHQREDESFWVLDGEFSVLLGERTLTAGMCCNFVVEPEVGVDDRKFSSSQRTDRE
jgi:uncharacterized cupin superfamily protein